MRQHLPGVDQNYHDHTVIDCVWEFPEPRPRQLVGEAVVFWKSRPELESPDLFAGQAAFPRSGIARYLYASTPTR